MYIPSKIPDDAGAAGLDQALSSKDVWTEYTFVTDSSLNLGFCCFHCLNGLWENWFPVHGSHARLDIIVTRDTFKHPISRLHPGSIKSEYLRGGTPAAVVFKTVQVLSVYSQDGEPLLRGGGSQTSAPVAITWKAC